ncbi:MAG TPA: hypothetical protein VGM53_07540 [Streptosporangiaceae bacterium]
MEPRAVIRDEEPIGCVGELILATRGAGGPGEVLVPVRGGTETFIAWSEHPLAKGTTVLVIDFRGARAVDVMEWADAPDGSTPS